MYERYIHNSFRIIELLIQRPVDQKFFFEEPIIKQCLMNEPTQVKSHYNKLMAFKSALLKELSLIRITDNGIDPSFLRPVVIAETLVSIYEANELSDLLKKLNWLQDLTETIDQATTEKVIIMRAADSRTLHFRLGLMILSNVLLNIVHQFSGDDHRSKLVSTALSLVFLGGLLMVVLAYLSRYKLDREHKVLVTSDESYRGVTQDLFELFYKNDLGKKITLMKEEPHNDEPLQEKPMFIFFSEKCVVPKSIKGEEAHEHAMKRP